MQNITHLSSNINLQLSFLSNLFQKKDKTRQKVKFNESWHNDKLRTMQLFSNLYLLERYCLCLLREHSNLAKYCKVKDGQPVQFIYIYSI